MNTSDWDLLFRQRPKIFCESANSAYSGEFFLLALLSAESPEATDIYAFTPQHMKRLSQMLTARVAEYEKEHGAIDTEWNPNITSPIQIKSDQDKGDENGKNNDSKSSS